MNLILGNSLEVLKGMPSESIDAVITDPPYLYLKHRLDAQWNEFETFKELYRVMKKDSFLVFFGRGSSFYRWNVICESLGFKFAEEIIWNKGQNTSPFLPISRMHETIAIHKKGNPKLNKVLIDKLDYDNVANPNNIIEDIRRIANEFGRINTLEEFEAFKLGAFQLKETAVKHGVTSKNKLYQNRNHRRLASFRNGRLLPSVIRVSREQKSMLHPTQKPLELMKHLVNLVSNEGDVVLDPFMGGGSTGVIAKDLNRDFIGIEILEEYYQIAKTRVNDLSQTSFA